jgi:L-alanine-DL-glutamate epimerase-like enolase superfamily enzyme
MARSHTTNMNANKSPNIKELEVVTYRVATDAPESDGTLKWDHTDVVVVHAKAGSAIGLGWSYAPDAAAELIRSIITPAVIGESAMATEGTWQKMNHQLRNAGRPGVGQMAVAAVDIALWDLKAKLLGISLVELLGPVRDAVDIYGSGGFTSYTKERLADQLGGWAAEGIPRVKMKVGRDAKADIDRVRTARKAIGENTELFVDANGGYTCKQALAMANIFSNEFQVTWFEEPRPSDDLRGLRMMRDRGPDGMDIAAGEYGDTPDYFRRMLAAGAVDCLQADATRCGGYTGFLKVAAQCDAFQMPLSAHCAPQLHSHVGCAVQCLRHVEYFHDHTRIDQLLFEGLLYQKAGTLSPDRTQTGHGMRLKEADAARYRI